MPKPTAAGSPGPDLRATAEPAAALVHELMEARDERRLLYLVLTGAPARSPSQGGCPGLLWGYDHLERSRWNVAQSVLVDVDALDDVAILGALHDLVLRVLGLVQRQSQLFHRFHLLVVIRGGKVYQVLRELLPENRFEPGAPTRSAAPPTGPSQAALLNQSLRVP